MKNWLTRSLRVALSEDARTLNAKHLKQGALAASRLHKIKEEAEQGLRRFWEESSDALPRYPTKDTTPTTAFTTTSKKGRVGQRKPKRDIVGVNSDDS